jgi:hypothetical protein
MCLVHDAFVQKFVAITCRGEDVEKLDTIQDIVRILCIISGGLPRLTMLALRVTQRPILWCLFPRCPTMYGLFDSEWASGTWVD